MNQPFDVANLLDVSNMSAHMKKIEAGLVEITKADNSALQEPISRLVRAGSKRLRSILVIAVASSQGKKVDDTVIAGCVAIELIHIASLVHDDIIDHADTRWGIPTVSSKEGLNQAILVGDFLFSKANEVAASINIDAAQLVATTISALIDGESREVAEEFNADRSIESMFTAIEGKTAALVSAACQMGAICADMGKAKTAALASYGHNFGLAFQLIDDVLDLASTEELMGKPTGNDIKEGVYTMPLILALHDKNANEAKQLLAQKDIPKLIRYLVEHGYIEQTLQEARKYNQQAAEALKNLPNSSRLASLPRAYLDWALTNLIVRPI